MTTNQHDWAEKLTSPSIDEQIATLRRISGSEAVAGVTATVVKMAASSDDEIRMWSAEALETAVRPEASEITTLVELLDLGDNGEVCYWAATMLGRLGCDAAKAVPALERCLSDSKYLPARERAAWALSQIGPSASSAVSTLRRTAQEAPPRLQRLATEALRMIGEAA